MLQRTAGNTPNSSENNSLARERLLGIALRPLRREATEVLEVIAFATKQSGEKS
jgi:hypothetical protein